VSVWLPCCGAQMPCTAHRDAAYYHKPGREETSG
jgi:hypothetical protein